MANLQVSQPVRNQRRREPSGPAAIAVHTTHGAIAVKNLTPDGCFLYDSGYRFRIGEVIEITAILDNAGQSTPLSVTARITRGSAVDRGAYCRFTSMSDEDSGTIEMLSETAE